MVPISAHIYNDENKLATEMRADLIFLRSDRIMFRLLLILIDV